MDWSCVRNLVVLNHPSALKSNRNSIRANSKHQLLQPHNKIGRMNEHPPKKRVPVHTNPISRVIGSDVQHAIALMLMYHAVNQLHLYKAIEVMHSQCLFLDRSNLEILNWIIMRWLNLKFFEWITLIRTQFICISQNLLAPFLGSCIQNEFVSRKCFIAQADCDIRIYLSAIQCSYCHCQSRYKATEFT